MAIVNLALILLFVYLVIYCVYLLTLNIKSFSGRDFIKEEKYNLQMNLAQNNLCVLIWATSKHKHLGELLRSLNMQTYSAEHFEVHLILQRDSETLPALPEFSHRANIHNIENPEFFSKDKALSTFIEKLIPENRFDAFVFIDPDRVVSEDYLENVSKSLGESSILTGRTSVSCRSRNFTKHLKYLILNAKQKFANNTIEISRRIFDLCTTIDSGNCAISADILEKTGRVCFETKDDELKYSLFLASNDLKPTYCPFMETIVDVDSFDATSTSISQKFALLKYYLPLLPKKPWYFVEYVISMLRPSLLLVLGSYFLVLLCSLKKEFISTISLKYVLHLGVFYGVNVLFGAISARLNAKEALHLLLYPFCILSLRYKVFTRNLSLKAIREQLEEEENINSATVNAIVTDGKKDLVCKLDLVSEDGMRRVVFRFNKKRFISDAHLRMFDAMSDITKRLDDKGFTLKVCQNCSYFNSNPDGTLDLLKGFCMHSTSQEERPTLVWNTCSAYKKLEFEKMIQN